MFPPDVAKTWHENRPCPGKLCRINLRITVARFLTGTASTTGHPCPSCGTAITQSRSGCDVVDVERLVAARSFDGDPSQEHEEQCRVDDDIRRKLSGNDPTRLPD